MRITYTDGRIGERWIENASPGKLHQLLGRGLPMKTDDEPAYLAWCKAEGVESLLPEPVPAKPAPEPVTAPQGAQDGWPDGYTHLRSGSWYTVTEPGGEAVSGKHLGKDAAQEAAWTHANG